MIKQIENSPSVIKMADEIAEGIAANKISPIDSMLQFCKLCEAIKSGEVQFDGQKELLAISESCNVFTTKKIE